MNLSLIWLICGLMLHHRVYTIIWKVSMLQTLEKFGQILIVLTTLFWKCPVTQENNKKLRESLELDLKGSLTAK